MNHTMERSMVATHCHNGSAMQILRQFGELSPDLIDMQRYAAWKAGDIRKALREGRSPTAGAPASVTDAEQELLDELGLPSVPGMRLLNIMKHKCMIQQIADTTTGSKRDELVHSTDVCSGITKLHVVQTEQWGRAGYGSRVVLP